MDRSVPTARGESPPCGDSFVHENAGLAVIADSDKRGDAAIERRLALVGIETRLRIPQTRQNEFPIGVDQLSIRGRRVALLADARDLIPLNRHLNFMDGRSPVAIDQGPALNHESRTPLGARNRSP